MNSVRSNKSKISKKIRVCGIDFISLVDLRFLLDLIRSGDLIYFIHLIDLVVLIF